MYSSRFVRVISALIVAVALPASGFGQTGSSAISGFVQSSRNLVRRRVQDRIGASTSFFTLSSESRLPRG